MERNLKHLDLEKLRDFIEAEFTKVDRDQRKRGREKGTFITYNVKPLGGGQFDYGLIGAGDEEPYFMAAVRAAIDAYSKWYNDPKRAKNR